MGKAGEWKVFCANWRRYVCRAGNQSIQKFPLDFKTHLCYKYLNFILYKAMRQTNGMRCPVQERTAADFPRGASGFTAARSLTTAERGGEPPPGTARYSRLERRFPFIKARRNLGGTVELFNASSLVCRKGWSILCLQLCKRSVQP